MEQLTWQETLELDLGQGAPSELHVRFLPGFPDLHNNSQCGGDVETLHRQSEASLDSFGLPLSSVLAFFWKPSDTLPIASTPCSSTAPGVLNPG